VLLVIYWHIISTGFHFADCEQHQNETGWGKQLCRSQGALMEMEAKHKATSQVHVHIGLLVHMPHH